MRFHRQPVWIAAAFRWPPRRPRASHIRRNRCLPSFVTIAHRCVVCCVFSKLPDWSNPPWSFTTTSVKSAPSHRQLPVGRMTDCRGAPDRHRRRLRAALLDLRGRPPPARLSVGCTSRALPTALVGGFCFGGSEGTMGFPGTSLSPLGGQRKRKGARRGTCAAVRVDCSCKIPGVASSSVGRQTARRWPVGHLCGAPRLLFSSPKRRPETSGKRQPRGDCQEQHFEVSAAATRGAPPTGRFQAPRVVAAAAAAGVTDVGTKCIGGRSGHCFAATCGAERGSLRLPLQVDELPIRRKHKAAKATLRLLANKTRQESSTGSRDNEE